MSDQYYIQDSRQYVGNSMLWWAPNGAGYVCDIRKAGVYTKEEALSRTNRETDVLWPKEYVDDKVSHHIDVQDCHKKRDGIKTMREVKENEKCIQI